ncbi:DUF4403 family protein [Novosphingobium lentum]|uniref:DUF4403 family protein n=1 Tax=Novosphingobium lentum TaxID=145287 RepID=UPI000830200E|nr:DUF4403 family protein [Novosphingobium lentum]
MTEQRIGRRPAVQAGLAALGLAAIALAGCSDKTHVGAPPRADDAIVLSPQTSVIAVPVHADISDLTAALEQAIPRTLWTIDKPGQTCVPPQHVKLLGIKLKVTPTLHCRIVGQVTRGPLTVSGSGQNIVVTMPIHATVSANDVGGILKRETATGDAQVRAVVKLDLARDWSLGGKVAIAYDWTREPGIDFLGQRIEFTSKADAKLQGVIARLEQTLPRELAKLHFHEKVADSWAKAFTSLKLNDARPPVWMRLTPKSLRYGGYAIEGRAIVLRLGMETLTESFVGDRPADPERTPLPPLAKLNATPGKLLFYIPVMADYRELEPVIEKALRKREARPFEVPGVGPVNAKFGKATIYGTPGNVPGAGRIAVGVTFSAQDAADRLGKSSGTVWLTGTPVNPAGTQQVSFADLAVSGVTDRTGTNLLLQLANTPGLSQTIADALAQNFAKDYNDLMGKIGRAIDEKREGNFVIRARIDNVRTGSLKAAGQGLYLPVWGTGTASVELDMR